MATGKEKKQETFEDLVLDEKDKSENDALQRVKELEKKLEDQDRKSVV